MSRLSDAIGRTRREAENLSQTALQGASMGYGDEIQAGFQGAGTGIAAAMMGRNPREEAIRAYESELGRTRGQVESAREEMPYAAGAAEMLGGFAVPGMGTVRAAQGAKSGLGRLARGMGVGSGTGAAYGFGAGEGLEDRLSGAGWGAGIGAGLGSLAPALNRGRLAELGGLSSLLGMLGRSGPAAGRQLSRGAQKGTSQYLTGEE